MGCYYFLLLTKLIFGNSLHELAVDTHSLGSLDARLAREGLGDIALERQPPDSTAVVCIISAARLAETPK